MSDELVCAEHLSVSDPDASMAAARLAEVMVAPLLATHMCPAIAQWDLTVMGITDNAVECQLGL